MSVGEHESRVSLVTDLDEVMDELYSEVVWMVRPRLGRASSHQRLGNMVELTDLHSINLAKTTTFETL